MAFRVDLTDTAEADVDSVLAWFVEQKATEAGGRWFSQLMSKLRTLESRPERCPVASESDELGLEVRELLFGRRRHKYRILFRMTTNVVVILRIRHAARGPLTHMELGD